MTPQKSEKKVKKNCHIFKNDFENLAFKVKIPTTRHSTRQQRQCSIHEERKIKFTEKNSYSRATRVALRAGREKRINFLLFFPKIILDLMLLPSTFCVCVCVRFCEAILARKFCFPLKKKSAKKRRKRKKKLRKFSILRAWGADGAFLFCFSRRDE